MVLSLIFATLVSSILVTHTSESPAAASAATITVGKTGGPDYAVIQYAVENASYGDTIYVWAGTYIENIVIDRSVTLVGNSSSNTTIDGGGTGDVIQVWSDWVNITCFNITGAGGSMGTAGVKVSYSDHFRISQCNVSNNSASGIVLSHSSHSAVENCLCEYNGNLRGIALDSCEKCVVANNTCRQNTQQGIYMISSSNNTLDNNTCRLNGGGGIRAAGFSGMQYSCHGNALTWNRCSNNANYGIQLVLARNGTVENNTCAGNGAPTGYGIELQLSANHTVGSNACPLNDRSGILVYSSDSNVLSNNTCSNNTLQCGVEVQFSGSVTASDNTCGGNGADGIRLFGSPGGVLSGNNCSLNAAEGVNVTAGSDGALVQGGSSVSNGGSGIAVRASDDCAVFGAEVSGCPTGINATYGTDGLLADNTSISGSGEYDLSLDSDSHITALNCSVNWTRVRYGDVNSNLTVQWYAHVRVTDFFGAPVPEANVTVRDGGGAEVYGVKAGGDGWRRWLVITQYVEMLTGKIYAGTPHNFTANETPYGNASRFVELDSSRVVHLAFEPRERPDPPWAFTIVSVGGDWVHPSWSASNSSEIVGYNVYINETGSSAQFTLLGLTDELDYNATGLAEETTYRFRVRALNASSLESPPLTGKGTTLDVTPPLPPGSPVFTEVQGDVLKFQWTASTSPDAEGYRIYLNKTGSSAEFDYCGWTSVQWYQMNGLVEETLYYVRVTAFDEVPLESTHSEGSMATRDATPPDPPTLFHIKGVGGNFVELDWEASVSGDVEGYEVWINESWSSTEFKPYAQTEYTAFKAWQLAQETIYHFRVRAYDEEPLYSDFTHAIYVRTPDVTPPSAPGNLIAYNPTGSTVMLSWDPSPEPDVVGYNVYLSQIGPNGGFGEYGSFGSSTSSIMVKELMPEITYYFVVTAFDDADLESPYSNVAWETTLDVTPPAKPMGLHATGAGPTWIELAWDSNTEEDLAGYIMYINNTGKGAGGPFHNVFSLSSYEMMCRVSGLVEETTYYFVLSAHDEVPNYSPLSSPASGKTSDGTAPRPPEDLNVGDATASSLSLRWFGSPDEDVRGYNVYRADSEFGGYDLVNPKPVFSTKYTDRGLEELSTYHYVVTALDEAPNESDPSEAASGTTKLGQHPPHVAIPEEDVVMFEDTVDRHALKLKYWFADANGDPLSYRCRGQENIFVTIHENNGTVVLRPARDWNGMETLTFSARDRKGECSASVNVTVVGVNDPPGPARILRPQNGTEVDDGAGLDLLGDCFDPDTPYGDKLKYSWHSNVSGKVGGGQERKGVLLPVGTHTLTLRVVDIHGASSESKINVTVRETEASDTDGDGMPDVWERLHELDPGDPGDAPLDPDGDGFTNVEEYLNGLDPWFDDTDDELPTSGDGEGGGGEKAGVFGGSQVLPLVVLAALLVIVGALAMALGRRRARLRAEAERVWERRGEMVDADIVRKGEPKEKGVSMRPPGAVLDVDAGVKGADGRMVGFMKPKAGGVQPEKPVPVARPIPVPKGVVKEATPPERMLQKPGDKEDGARV